MALAAFFCLSTFAQLPSVKLKDLNGKVVDTAKLSNDGKPFVISFFATWCKPCNRELKAISEQYADWQDETGMKVIAVSIDQAQNINKVKPLVDGEGWEYEVLLDPNSEFRRAMGVQMIPHVFVIDEKRTNHTNLLVASRCHRASCPLSLFLYLLRKRRDNEHVPYLCCILL